MHGKQRIVLGYGGDEESDYHILEERVMTVEDGAASASASSDARAGAGMDTYASASASASGEQQADSLSAVEQWSYLNRAEKYKKSQNILLYNNERWSDGLRCAYVVKRARYADTHSK